MFSLMVGYLRNVGIGDDGTDEMFENSVFLGEHDGVVNSSVSLGDGNIGTSNKSSSAAVPQ